MTPLISVVIPAYGRQELLDQCLARLADQTLAPDQYEVIVVDDGSPKPLTVQGRATLLRQENQGPAAARNHGVREAGGQAIVFIGDDILVPRDFLEVHMQFHAQRSSAWEGMLGRLDWPAEFLRDPYMNWLDRSGLQFGFHGLEPGQRLPYFHFYTSNVSVKREVLLAFPFDEDFPDAAFEDADLGARLTDAGFRLYYEPQAQAEHRHFYTLEESCAHRRRVGQSARIFERKQPPRAQFKWIRRYPPPFRWLAATGWAGQDRYFYYRNSEAFWEGYRQGP